MADKVENLILERILEQFRALRGGQDRIEHELREVQLRLSSLESAVIGTKRDGVHTQEDVARQQVTIDGIKERLDRIERRLDLREEA